MLLFAVILALLLPPATGHRDIPKDLLKKFVRAGSFRDFLADVHVIYHPEHTNRHISKNLAPTAQPIRLKQGSFGGGSFPQADTASEQIDAHTYDYLNVLHDIHQGNDTCKLQSVCVPIPVINDDPQVLIYPRCYETVTRKKSLKQNSGI
ncbi:unnamed protein product [Caenorhabditis auriculariae]|uniref:Uncharacterized protein n=1 Tax=Caenorhabditis auriculariae TaxID=2777116 RepID=A0A8S1HMC9_9PELO|nr:unnamed protein product [Caenorhabditis auriculariae]